MRGASVPGMPTDVEISASCYWRAGASRLTGWGYIFGEKSSLDDVVTPIAERYHADLFLETGEISDSHVYLMAAAAAEDGRPMRVFTLADCDPAGWQMPVSIGRKLQALRDLLAPWISISK